MPANDDQDNLDDYEYARTRERQEKEHPSLHEQSLAEARKCLYAPVSVREGEKSRTTTFIMAFVDALTLAAAQGNTNAVCELEHLEQHNQRQRDRAASKRGYAESPIRALEKKHKPIADVGRALCTSMYVQMEPCFSRAFEGVRGNIKPSSALIPYYLDSIIVTKALNRARRHAREKRSKPDYKVGKNRPPVATRFTKDYNPRKKIQAMDFWDEYAFTATRPSSGRRREARQLRQPALRSPTSSSSETPFAANQARVQECAR